MGKIKQDRVMTAIVGSYPKPAFLFRGKARSLLDNFGMNFYELEKRIGREEFRKLTDRAAIMAIEDQNSAGIDLATDGEERRGHYISHILRGLDGIDFNHLRKKTIRGGVYVRKLPVVKGRITYRNPILVDDYEFTERHSRGIAKIGLPGPLTAVDSVADEYYRNDRRKMAMDYARAVHQEVWNLIQRGCRVIQFDDPVILRYPDAAREWGVEALHKCFEGLEEMATYIVHVCCGYPHKALDMKGVPYKADKGNYRDILKLFSNSEIDVISIEGSQCNTDLSVLTYLGRKTLMLGVVDVGEDRVESVESIVSMAEEALQYIPPERLILAPDCGMLMLSRVSARKKLANIVAAADILNHSL
jgi:5-methyltetrahydropteroyltriglutamate--homocysteine methyltransferase